VENSLIDNIDREILGLLLVNSRMSYRELSERLSLSANAIADRVNKLQKRRIIRRFTVVIDERAIGNEISAIIDVKLCPNVSAESFERALIGLKGVESACLTTGTFDYSLVVRCRNTHALAKLTEYLRLEAGAAETLSRLLLREHSPLD
jgi:Lrp/AsnC family transcriptional regulator, leucine-responsive regulatory protein